MFTVYDHTSCSLFTVCNRTRWCLLTRSHTKLKKDATATNTYPTNTVLQIMYNVQSVYVRVFFVFCTEFIYRNCYLEKPYLTFSLFEIKYSYWSIVLTYIP